jgi:hypothetical protein
LNRREGGQAASLAIPVLGSEACEEFAMVARRIEPAALGGKGNDCESHPSLIEAADKGRTTA